MGCSDPSVGFTLDCSCSGDRATVVLTLGAIGACPITYQITNPFSGAVANVVVPSNGSTSQTIALPLAADWVIPITADGVDVDVRVGGCCEECLCDATITLEYFSGDDPIDFVVTHPTTGEDMAYRLDPGEGPITVVILGLGSGTWTVPVTANAVDVSRTVVVTAPEGCAEPCPPLEISGFIPCKPEQVLGDGSDLRVMLMARGATAVIAELTPVSGQFTRELEATSTLQMVGMVTGRLGDVCCDDWEEIRPWATEMLIFRDGRDAWCGPVTDVKFDYGKITVEADDLTAWWDRRVCPDLVYNGVDLGTIFQGVHDAAMAPDASPNIFMDVQQVGVIGSRSTQASQYVYASDVLDELAKTSLDYTCYGRTVLVRGQELDEAPWLVLTDDHWSAPPTVRERGNDQATRVVVRGEGVQSVATAPANYLDYYGLLVRVFDETAIKDQGSCDLAAQTRLDLLKDPVYIETPEGATLKPDAPVTLAQLIPGIRVRVDTQASCRQIVADFRLSKVEVNFNGEVSIDLQPIGTIDTLDEE